MLTATVAIRSSHDSSTGVQTGRRSALSRCTTFALAYAALALIGCGSENEPDTPPAASCPEGFSNPQAVADGAVWDARVTRGDERIVERSDGTLAVEVLCTTVRLDVNAATGAAALQAARDYIARGGVPF